MGDFDHSVIQTCPLKDHKNGVYIFFISSKVFANGNTFATREGIGIWDNKDVTMHIKEDAKVLLIEVSMNL